MTSVLVAADFSSYRASRRQLGSPSAGAGTEAVVVLGFRNRATRANRVNRFRVRAGLRSRNRHSARSMLVFSGGAVDGGASEASAMEQYARLELGYRGRIELEEASRSTWENVTNVVPLLEAVEVIKFVSNAQHAEMARAYLWTQRPDLAQRLAPGSEHRFGEDMPLKLAAWAKAAHARIRDSAARRAKPQRRE